MVAEEERGFQKDGLVKQRKKRIANYYEITVVALYEI